MTILGSVMVIQYLRSKPPLSQTIMDFANKVLFVSTVPPSVLISVIVTLTSIFNDCGELAAYILGYSAPAAGDHLVLQLGANAVVQGLIFRRPELLESERFENVVKFFQLVIIPLSVILAYCLVLICGVQITTYSKIRGINFYLISKEEPSWKGGQMWVFLRGSANLLFGLLFVVCRALIRYAHKPILAFIYCEHLL